MNWPGHRDEREVTQFCFVHEGRLFVAHDAARHNGRDAVLVSVDGQAPKLLQAESEPLADELISNGDFSEGTRGWRLLGGSLRTRFGVDFSDEWRLADGHTAFVRGDAVASHWVALAYSEGRREPLRVTGARHYVAEALIGTHRCSAELVITFMDLARNPMGETRVSVPAGYRGGQHRADYFAVRQSVESPAGATGGRLEIRKSPTQEGERDSFMFVAEVSVTRPGRTLPLSVVSSSGRGFVATWHDPAVMSIRLPSTLMDRSHHRIAVMDSDTGEPIGRRTLSFASERAFVGNLERIGGGAVVGWARDRADARYQPSVALEIDGIEVDRKPTMRTSPSGDCRFELDVPHRYADALSHHILVRSVPDGAVVVEQAHVLSMESEQPPAGSSGLTIGQLEKRVASLNAALGASQRERREVDREVRELRLKLSMLEAEIRPVTAENQSIVGPAGVRVPGRVAVVSSDIGGEPAGRAVALGRFLAPDWDVDIIGPTWGPEGDAASSALAASAANVVAFRCRDLLDFMAPALVTTARTQYDLVFVSGPRLPSILLGLMSKEHSGCPLILDVGEDRSALVGKGSLGDLELLRQHIDEVIEEPHGAIATRVAIELGRWADAIIEMVDGEHRAENQDRIEAAIASAMKSQQPLSGHYRVLRGILESGFGHSTRRRTGTMSLDRAAPILTSRPHDPPDLAVFWKQNDTGIYGRRPEMLVKHLQRIGALGRVVYFDAPVPLEQLGEWAAASGRDTPVQDALMARNTLARWLKKLDEPQLVQRVYLYDESGRGRLGGRPLPRLEDYPDYVKLELSNAGFQPDRTWAWVFPVVWQFPELDDSHGFERVIVDLVDDQRTWRSNPRHRERLSLSYQDTLARADLVLTNCHPVAHAFQSLAPSPIHVVPNGAEPMPSDGAASMPRSLAGLPRPLIGYVGNMRDRIDWTLLREIAERRPPWTLLLAGPTEGHPEASTLASLPNVVFPGVVEYVDLPAYLAAFDVGIVPHTLDAQARSMNPLKVYNYLAAGLDVVATAIPNLDDVASHVEVAETPDEFIGAIERALAKGPRNIDPADYQRLMQHISWETRATRIAKLIEGMAPGS